MGMGNIDLGTGIRVRWDNFIRSHTHARTHIGMNVSHGAHKAPYNVHNSVANNDFGGAHLSQVADP